jgi:hypothetical protein
MNTSSDKNYKLLLFRMLGENNNSPSLAESDKVELAGEQRAKE